MRRLLSLLLCLSLCLSSVLILSSCHGTKGYEDFEVPEEFDEEKEYEIVFWAKNEKNIKQTRVYQKAIEEFEKLYPNIKVTMKLYSDYKVIYRDVINNISTGTTPNVCITYPDHVATYLAGGNRIVSLDKLMYDEKYGLGGSEIRFDAPTVDEMVPEFMKEGVINGSQYALPFMRSTEALYYNKDYIEALGYEIPEVMTWDFVFEVAEAALAKDADGNYILNGEKKMIPFVYKSTDNMMIQMLEQYGGDYITSEGDLLLFNDTAREILYTVADHAETGAFSTFARVSYPADLLNRGQCVFAVDSTAGSVWMGTDGPLSDVSPDEAIDFELGVSVIPQPSEDSEPVMISQGPSICIFNKEDRNEVIAAWIFVQYLLSNDVQIAYSQTEGYVPVTKKAQESDEYLEYLSRAGELDEDGDNYLYYAPKIEVTKILLENTENTFVTPVFNGSASVRMAAGEMIEEVVKAVNAKPKKTVNDEFIDSLYEKMVSLYHLDTLAPSSPDSDTDGGAADKTAIEDTPLPTVSLALIISLVSIWIFIASYVLYSYLRRRRKQIVGTSLDN